MSKILKFPNRMQRPMIASWQEWVCYKMSFAPWAPKWLQVFFIGWLGALHGKRNYPSDHEGISL
jgi:hypothetical protein